MSFINAELAQLADVVRGITFPTGAKRRKPGKGLVACLRTTNVQSTVEWDDLLYVDETYVRNPEQFVRKGDIVVSMSNSLELVGKSALITDVPERAAFGAFVAIVRARDGIDPSYLFHALRSPAFRSYVREVASTTTNISNINSSKLIAAKISLFGSKTNKAVADRIDELFSHIDEGERALERVQKLVERYRQSVLKAAVTGELTREWREKWAKSGAPIETGEALLARILAARREAWEQAELDKMKAKGIKPKDDKWKQKYVEPASPDTSELPELPEGWVWASADQLTSLITDGEHATPPRTEDGIPLLSARNVRDGFLSLENIDFVSPETHRALQKRLKIRAGDVLLSCSGSVGRTCVVPSGVDFSLVRSVAVLRPVVPIGDYISLTLRSLLLQNQIESRKSQTAQANIFQGSIKKLVLPLPSTEELERVVDAIERQLSLCEDVSKSICRAEIRSASARQSVLKQAFKGELVEQCTLDEPAAILLKRIATERNVASVQPKRGSNRKKAV